MTKQLFTHHPRYLASYLEDQLEPRTVEDLVPGLQGYFEDLIRQQLEERGSKNVDTVPLSVVAQLVVSTAIQQHRYTAQAAADEWREGRRLLCGKIQDFVSRTLTPPDLTLDEEMDEWDREAQSRQMYLQACARTSAQ
jgi:hypothetical protein